MLGISHTQSNSSLDRAKPRWCCYLFAFKPIYLIIVTTLVTGLSQAQTTKVGNQQSIEEIKVHAEDLRYEIEVDELDSANLLNAEAIQKLQASDVFSVLDSIPGLTIEGGLTTGGKSFSIRGFSDNEDVLVQIDGVTQNFEKYRSGSGVEIEPELLKEIAVFRGGTSVTQGAGYLGGVIQMETKDARDYLDSGEVKRWGATLRSGYNSNNDGKLYSLTAYALPYDGFDLLINVIKRNTNDLTRPNGKRFEDSDEQQESLLAKAEYYNDDLIVSYSFRSSEDEGLEPFDLVENNAIFSSLGNVFRLTEESAHSFRSQWNPISDWIKTDLVFGIIDKQVTEQRSGSESFNSTGNISNPISFFQFDIWTATLKNQSQFDWQAGSLGLVESNLQVGLQAGNEDRSSEQEENGLRVEYALQPSGSKKTEAAFLETGFNWNDWRLSAGFRYDRYRIAPKDDLVLSFLQQRSGKNEIKFAESTPSISLDKTWGNMSWFYHYSGAFSAPLVTQYFSFGASGISACNDFAEILNPPNLADFGGNFFDPNYQSALANFQTRQISQGYLLEANYFCGDVYRPEDSTTQEIGTRIDLANWLALGVSWHLKLTYFETDTKHTLDSIRQDTNTLSISQPGTEFRSGIEFEMNYQSDYWRLALSSSTLNGYRTDINDNKQAVRGGLRAPPGDNINISVERQFELIDLTLGAKVKGVRSRLVDQNTSFNAGVNDAQLERVAGYAVADIYAHYQAIDDLSIRFSIVNLLNKEYQLRGFGGNTSVANIAAGRDYRVSISYSF